MKLAARGSVHRWATLGVLFFAAVACERKAPSPDECVDYALITFRVHHPNRSPAVLEDKDEVDANVVKCLTTLDKELVACTKRRPGSRSCDLEFIERERRRKAPRE